MQVTKIGFVVVDKTDEWEQTLALDFGDDLPDAGILGWRQDGPAFVFPTRKLARDAIKRTDHFAKAFGWGSLPTPKCCQVVLLEMEVTAPPETESEG